VEGSWNYCVCVGNKNCSLDFGDFFMHAYLWAWNYFSILTAIFQVDLGTGVQYHPWHKIPASFGASATSLSSYGQRVELTR